MSAPTLTERYVREVVRRIPADQRDDVADELRNTIADTIDAREAADPQAAEREVLTEMGDPIPLAAKYADRPMVLIGPDLYPAYVRLLRLLLTIVLPIVVLITVVPDVLEGADIGEAISAGIAALLTVGGQLIAWPTVVFALIERSGNRSSLVGKKWTPDQLPEIRQVDKKNASGAIAGAVWYVALIGLIVWQRTAEPYRADGQRLQVLDPALWSGWIWPILIGLTGLAVLELVRVATGRTLALAVWSTAAEALFALPLAWILYRHMFFNPEFLEATAKHWTQLDNFYKIAALGVLAVAITESFKRFRKLSR